MDKSVVTVLVLCALFKNLLGYDGCKTNDPREYCHFDAYTVERQVLIDKGDGLNVILPCQLRYKNASFIPDRQQVNELPYRVDLTWYMVMPHSNSAANRYINLYIFEKHYDDRIGEDLRLSRKKEPYEERYYLLFNNFNEIDATRKYCCYLNINTHPSSTSCTTIVYREYDERTTKVSCGEGYSNDEVIPVSAERPATVKVSMTKFYPENPDLSVGADTGIGGFVTQNLSNVNITKNDEKDNRFDLSASFIWTQPKPVVFVTSMLWFNITADEKMFSCKYTQYIPPEVKVESPSYPSFFQGPYFGCRVSFLPNESVPVNGITFRIQNHMMDAVSGGSEECPYTIGLRWWENQLKTASQCASSDWPSLWNYIDGGKETGSPVIPLYIEFKRSSSASSLHGRYSLTVRAVDEKGTDAVGNMSVKCSEMDLFPTTTTTTTTSPTRPTSASPFEQEKTGSGMSPAKVSLIAVSAITSVIIVAFVILYVLNEKKKEDHKLILV